MKTVGIIGCGLIGGSFAKAIKAKTSLRVLGFDRDESVLCRAELEQAIDARCTKKTLAQCEMVLIALPPRAVVDFVRENGAFFRENTLVVDCAGVKRAVCPECRRVARENGFRFIGGHPMAGKERSGFSRATATLFGGASMLLAFEEIPALEELEKIRKFFLSLGFGRIVTTTSEKHDRIVAYTSQLAHVLSASFVKSPTADEHAGYSAGSFRDMIRVASVDPDLWSELFLANRDFLAEEVRMLIGHLSDFAAALEKNDRETLRALLVESGRRKAKIESLRTLRAAERAR